MQLTNAMAQTPNSNELNSQKETQILYSIQQIIALKAHLEVLKKGYDIVQKGLGLIGEITGDDYDRHTDYFASLKRVNPAIGNSAKVAGILALQTLVLRDFRKLLDDCRNDENFTPEEINYLAKVNANLIRWCSASIDELKIVITSEEAQMKDNERIQRIDKVYEEMLDKYAFTNSFGNSTRMLSLQRAKERRGIETSLKLFEDR